MSARCRRTRLSLLRVQLNVLGLLVTSSGLETQLDHTAYSEFVLPSGASIAWNLGLGHMLGVISDLT